MSLDAMRRRLLGGVLLAPFTTRLAGADLPAMIARPIPAGDESLPVIGMGTWQTFDVRAGAARGALAPVLGEFLAAGARVLDSSPMYGQAEETLGELLAADAQASRAFVATKVWTRGREAGEQQMRESLAKLKRRRLDLMQVHNLLDLDTHLTTLRAWRERGALRYIGITHYHAGAHDEVERVLRREPVDFLQINYSLAEREAENRLLPLAQERGVAVLINRPFAEGALFRRTRGASLPAIATELDCASWAQFFLKFIVGHPAVTAALPATSKAEHLRDNLAAGTGRLPDSAQRRAMAEAFARL